MYECDKLARVYSRKRGKHGSKRPPAKVVPRWLKVDKVQVEQLIMQFAKERKSIAVIGTILRDQYGIPDVKIVTGKTISKILRENNLYPEFPEDLLSLFKKAVAFREHLARSKKDKSALKGLQNLESKIRRSVKYYARKGKIDPNFTYDPEKVKLIVQK